MARIPRYPWTIRLGEAQQTNDGLVGYVLAGDYDHFETAIDPVAGSGGHLRPIGDTPLELDFGDHNTTVATVLCDPRAAVHATTDILATKRVFVPQEFTDQAIARMTVNFRTGPLLAGTTELLGAQDQVRETVLMPAPTGITGPGPGPRSTPGSATTVAVAARAVARFGQFSGAAEDAARRFCRANRPRTMEESLECARS
ncbi:hypothetical protein AB0952_39155 [Streptomyces caniferus]|uniref:hypothetical protein n=1 Tax=Streptomyces caniferus TaxID=285557 RepID=UPI003452AE73